MITPEQIRGARAMLGLAAAELAKAAGISVSDLDGLERGNADGKATPLHAVEAALKAAGIVFQADGEMADGGPGIRLARQSPKSFDTIEKEVVQYPEYLENDAPPGAGG